MSELRTDRLLGHQVIVAPERERRPNEFVAAAAAPSDSIASARACPFCSGHEDETPAPLSVIYEPGQSDADPDARWRVRVVPNLFPALSDATPEEPLASPSMATSEPRSPGAGLHEVIIESPEHLTQVAQLGIEQWRLVVEAYASRLAEHRRRGRFAYGFIFRNSGMMAGASLAHAHSQLLVTPFTPPVVAAEIAAAARHRAATGACYYCDLTASESAGPRRIAQSPRFVVFCPFASRFAGETWIVPSEHPGHFDATPRDALAELADLSFDVLSRIERVQQNIAYNMILRAAPFDMRAQEHYHWHMEILPRQAHLAGLELGGGTFINPWPPEDAAAFLRRLKT